jgi:hypothetical protein
VQELVPKKTKLMLQQQEALIERLELLEILEPGMTASDGCLMRLSA